MAEEKRGVKSRPTNYYGKGTSDGAEGRRDEAAGVLEGIGKRKTVRGRNCSAPGRVRPTGLPNRMKEATPQGGKSSSHGSGAGHRGKRTRRAFPMLSKRGLSITGGRRKKI